MDSIDTGHAARCQKMARGRRRAGPAGENKCSVLLVQSHVGRDHCYSDTLE